MKKKKIYTIYLVSPESEYLQLFTDFWQKWSHMIFSFSSCPEARHVMSGVSPDIVVCHLNPLEETQHFLLWIQTNFPNAIRIMFGSKEDGNLLKRIVAGGVAHRDITLPVTPAALQKIFSKDLATRSSLMVRKCWAFVESDMGLPSLPVVVKEIEDVLRDPEFSISQLAEVVEKDPAISVRLLKVVNSAAFSKKNQIADIHHAVSFLGAAQIKEIVLFFCAMIIFPPNKSCRQETKNVASHCFRVSQLAARIAKTVAPGREKETATAALMHDIGKLVFLSRHCSLYQHYIKHKNIYRYSAEIFENATFGITHAQLGSSLLLWWNMPMVLVDVAANHNKPLAELSGVTKAVAIADRCLMTVQTKGRMVTDLETISSDLPLDSWQKLAIQMLG